MGELRALLWLLVGIAKILFYVVRGVVRLVARALGQLEQLGDAELRRRRGEDRAAPARATRARPPAAPATSATSTRAAAATLAARAATLAAAARALAAVARERRATRRFAPTLEELEAREATVERLARRGDAAARPSDVERDELLLRIVGDMIAERRSPRLVELLGDTDALADASYAPIVEHCTNRRIRLASDRAATIVDGDKLYFYSVSDPSGLAAIVLPESFTRELVAWPAIAHEIGHDFYHSVDGLPEQLAKALALGGEIAIPAVQAAGGVARAVADVPQRAVTAWREELFADAFGTMMLGPAYVQTMARLFASPAEPARALVLAVDAEGGGLPRYEEHPPGHVRVVVACRLLGQMGYGAEADRLERRWRAEHAEPDALYVPLSNGRYAALAEEPVLARAAQVGRALYLTGLPTLGGQPLRSIPGLDFGPREHAEAERCAARFAALRPATPGDPRMLVAGAVLATLAQPRRAAQIYALARAAIRGLDAARAADDDAAADARADADVVDATALREALILGALLAPPRAWRARAG